MQFSNCFLLVQKCDFIQYILRTSESANLPNLVKNVHNSLAIFCYLYLLISHLERCLKITTLNKNELICYC